MMVKKIMEYLKIFTTVIMAICVVLVFAMQHPPRSLQKKTQLGAMYLFERDTEYFGAVTDYATCDNILYVLYEAKSVLKCYDLSGNYLHSYCFLTCQNGRAELQRTNTELYLKDRENNYYQLSNGKMTRFLHRNQNADEIKILQKSFVSDAQKRTDAKGNTYTLLGAAIWKTDSQGNQVYVMQRPWILQFIAYKYIFIFQIIWMVLIAVSLLYEKFGRN